MPVMMVALISLGGVAEDPIPLAGMSIPEMALTLTLVYVRYWVLGVEIMQIYIPVCAELPKSCRCSEPSPELAQFWSKWARLPQWLVTRRVRLSYVRMTVSCLCLVKLQVRVKFCKFLGAVQGIVTWVPSVGLISRERRSCL